MTTGGSNMKDYKEAQKRTDVSIGESVKIIRELQELSQNDLSAITGRKSKGISQSIKMSPCSFSFSRLEC